MSTGIKVTMMLAVADSISQCKWNWFAGRRRAIREKKSGHARSLKDLETFDSASRGAYGSVMLISKSRPDLVTLGALLTILSLALGTLSQQIINFDGRTLYNTTLEYAFPRKERLSCELATLAVGRSF